MKRLVIEIPEELHRRLKVMCALEGKTMKQVVEALMEGYVATAERRLLLVPPRENTQTGRPHAAGEED